MVNSSHFLRQPQLKFILLQLSGAVINAHFFFRKIQRLLVLSAWIHLQVGKAFLSHSLTLHLDVGTMWHACMLWEELWHSMPQSGRVSITVNSLLQNYKECCRAERK